jgi:hypothetical protein
MSDKYAPFVLPFLSRLCSYVCPPAFVLQSKMFPLSVVVGTLALGTLSAYAQAVQGCVSSSLILSTGVKALSPANYAECLVSPRLDFEGLVR